MNFGIRGKHGRAQQEQDAPVKQNFITREATIWWNRLLGAAKEGSLADQDAMYDSHRTTRDFVCNAVGTGAWGAVFPLLTIVVTQLVGAEQAGMFSMAFITALLLMFVGNYGVRTFQVSDLEETHSFSDYQVNRLVTCVIMLIAALLYCTARGYGADMFTICMAMVVYKGVDALADVYEGRLQQVDKLYLAGISLAVRSVACAAVFSLALLLTRSLSFASIAMAVVAVITLIVLTLPLALFETERSRRWSMAGVMSLLKQCFAPFLALFLFNLIENMPKFVMEGSMTYDNQLYFNAMFFPAQAILLSAGLIYKPLLVRLTSEWADPARRARFDLAIVAMLCIVVAMTVGVIALMAWIGVPLLSFMYGIDFEPMRGLCYVMVAAGGTTAAIDFLYQVITVLRRAGSVTKLYLITFGFSLFIPALLIDFTGLPGAVMSYLIIMCILAALLIVEYISIRLDFLKPDSWLFKVANKAKAAADEASGASAEDAQHAPKTAARPAHSRTDRAAASRSTRSSRPAARPARTAQPSQTARAAQHMQPVRSGAAARPAPRDATPQGARRKPAHAARRAPGMTSVSKTGTIRMSAQDSPAPIPYVEDASGGAFEQDPARRAPQRNAGKHAGGIPRR